MENQASFTCLQEARRRVAVGWNHFDHADPDAVDAAVNETYRAEVEAAQARRHAGTLVQAHRQGQQIQRMIDSLAAQVLDREADRRLTRRVWALVACLISLMLVTQAWTWLAG